MGWVFLLPRLKDQIELFRINQTAWTNYNQGLHNFVIRYKNTPESGIFPNEIYWNRSVE